MPVPTRRVLQGFINKGYRVPTMTCRRPATNNNNRMLESSATKHSVSRCVKSATACVPGQGPLIEWAVRHGAPLFPTQVRRIMRLSLKRTRPGDPHMLPKGKNTPVLAGPLL